MKLKVNYEELNTLGTKVGTQRESFQDLLDNIKTINTELESHWKGSDATKYTNEVKEQAKTMQELSDTIKDISDFLIQAGKAYAEAVMANMGENK